jgi:hypothetical protein
MRKLSAQKKKTIQIVVLFGVFVGNIKEEDEN